MAVYAIGDLHLSLGSDKPMDVFGGNWDNYVEKITLGFKRLNDDDVCVLCGDLTWGMNLQDSLNDFLFINNLPGKKIILKGNHDYWWTTATKAERFFDLNSIDTISILNNNCYIIGDTAICGTRGWFFNEDGGKEHDKKVMLREIQRFEASLKAAGDTPEKICFFHYPPVFLDFRSSEIIGLMHDYGVTDCYYGHIHGKGHTSAKIGCDDGINYHMVSADYIDFIPQLVSDIKTDVDIVKNICI